MRSKKIMGIIFMVGVSLLASWALSRGKEAPDFPWGTATPLGSVRRMP